MGSSSDGERLLLKALHIVRAGVLAFLGRL
jgi:hypothetical protein